MSEVNRGLSLNLLGNIMQRIAVMEQLHPMRRVTQEFLDLVRRDEELADETRRLEYINRHLDFLRDDGFIAMSTTGHVYQRGGIQFTAKGRKFVQPELAEFGQPVLPEIIKYVEQQIDTSTVPASEKQGWVFKLRKAAAERAVDTLMNLLAEVIARTIRSA